MRQPTVWISGWTVGGLMALAGVPAAFASLPPAPPGVQVTTQYGIEFSTIGSPGNQAFHGADHASNPYFIGSGYEDRGTINYGYRIARTELTIGQWAQFVNAIAPHWEGNLNNPQESVKLLGYGLVRDSGGHYSAFQPWANDPAQDMSWLATAAYCNWLCNGQRSDADAFRTGAYDLRSINLANPAPRTEPVTADANAPFRLPTIDEWSKAAYFDPNRNGEGQAGWWLFPASLDRPLLSGLPENGGETSAGDGIVLDVNRSYPVASYQSVQSPWGLFDMSGGVNEWTSDADGVDLQGAVVYFTFGTQFNMPLNSIFDQPGLSYGGGRYGVVQFGTGIRLVASVPTPSCGLLLLAMSNICIRRPRHA